MKLFLFFFHLFFLAISSSKVFPQFKDCKPLGKLEGKEGACNSENDSECCEGGKTYDTFQCSPKVTGQTPATLTLNSFQEGGDGGGEAACDGKFHPDNKPVVALSTGWFDNQSRCGKEITIMANGKRVNAIVVDECDSALGCDDDHDFQPPCKNNIVDASKAVWEALDIPKKNWGEMDILWTDANFKNSTTNSTKLVPPAPAPAPAPGRGRGGHRGGRGGGGGAPFGSAKLIH